MRTDYSTRRPAHQVTMHWLACIVCLLPFSLARPANAQTAPVPELLNFQGRIAKPDGTPVADGTVSIRFSLWSASSGGSEKWFQVMNPVVVRNGGFAVLLGNGNPISADIVNNDTYLEIKVGEDAPLAPRQRLVSVAYALKANTVADNAITSAKLADGSVTNAKIAPGSLTADRFASTTLNPLVWLLGGNSGTNGTQFLGTTDNNALEFRANNHRAMRYTYAESSFGTGYEFRSINVLGGSETNSISPGITGATIAGGGLDYLSGTDLPNTVTGNYGTVGGGFGNTADYYSVVAGGFDNITFDRVGCIAGGISNEAGYYASVGGGTYNHAAGDFSTVPGGFVNTASGECSFAAGQRAQANHDGTFVWGDDSTYNAFTSTGVNQFLIRATGGVGINTNSPNGSALAVVGTVESRSGGFKFPDGTVQISASGASVGSSLTRTTISVASGATVNIPAGYGIVGVTGNGNSAVVLPRANSVPSGTTLILNLEQPVGGSGVITVRTQSGDKLPNTPAGSSPALITNLSTPALRFYSDGGSNWYQW